MTIYFKNGTEQKYTKDQLKLDKWANALLTDLDTLANSGGLRGKAQIELWGSMKTFIMFLGKLPEHPKSFIHDIQVDIDCLKQKKKN